MRRLTVALAATVALGTTVVAGAGPVWATTEPGVNATPHNEGGEWWTTDGCTAVPDSGSDLGTAYDFHHACKHHDGCYRYHWSDRATCDQWFYNDMLASCEALGSGRPCEIRAGAYYQGVRKFGQPSWESYSYTAPMGNVA
ncbi:hypothetical protein AGRA3207_002064 [Actinomadura graeca]|uniref:Secreted protein n=1 Tax=Actinomadura graeca TaxID=2750812 RepID=A0ABX8QSQ9_9ACTN|nr:phospholipase A2 [Actinomadura graeca]QXJ21229.1 hypothetical protein AGRA3207_002064 [Actinomadura graeca]